MKYFDNPVPENMPILGDLYHVLLSQEEKEAHHVATTLEIYVKGSLNLFNHRTNVDISNRLVCYNIKELGKQLKKLGMLVVQDQVWGRVRVTVNRQDRAQESIPAMPVSIPAGGRNRTLRSSMPQHENPER